MTEAPLMPKATAVWLVENTSLTFDQIAEFCKLHPLEVKGIADGEVATGIKGYDPISTGQLTREEIAAAEKDRVAPPATRDLQGARAGIQEAARGALHAAVAPPGPAERHSLAAAQSSRVEGRADHAPGRHHQAYARIDPRAQPLEFRQPPADGPGDPRPVLADRPRLRGQSRRQGSPEDRGGPHPDPGLGRGDDGQAGAGRRRPKFSARPRPSRSRAKRRSTSIRCSASSRSSRGRTDARASLSAPRPERSPPRRTAARRRAAARARRRAARTRSRRPRNPPARAPRSSRPDCTARRPAGRRPRR